MGPDVHLKKVIAYPFRIFNAYLNKENINVISTGKIKYRLNILFVKDQAAVIEMADSDSDIFILKQK